jgi:Matrixin
MNTARSGLKRLSVMAGMILSAIGSNLAIAPANALTFNFIAGTGITAEQLAGFQAAGNLWSGWYDDSVTINININFTNIAAGSLGGASPSSQFFDYSDVYTALNADRTSADDDTAVSSLSSNGSYRKLTNYTTDNPNTTDLSIPYVTTGNRIAMTTANAKALGLIAANDTALDATISLNSSVAWSYGNTIAPGTYDFIGVAAHEIGHALGFNSAVDALDNTRGTLRASDYSLVPLDLFRYSEDSRDENAVDFTVGTTDKYFSIDGGVTEIASLEKGVSISGYQAQHWLETSPAIGIMDPVTGINEFKLFTRNDIRAFDVVGWDRSALSFAVFAPTAPATAVPEPESYVGTLICVAFGVRTIVKYRKKSQAPIAISTDSPE